MQYLEPILIDSAERGNTSATIDIRNITLYLSEIKGTNISMHDYAEVATSVVHTIDTDPSVHKLQFHWFTDGFHFVIYWDKHSQYNNE